VTIEPSLNERHKEAHRADVVSVERSFEALHHLAMADGYSMHRDEMVSAMATHKCRVTTILRSIPSQAVECMGNRWRIRDAMFAAEMCMTSGMLPDLSGRESRMRWARLLVDAGHGASVRDVLANASDEDFGGWFIRANEDAEEVGDE
jgi:hypothetical protein